jgi:hypothetical protein
VKIPLEGNEHVVVRTRRHPRALRGPLWMLLILMFLTGCVLGLLTRVPSLGSAWADATWILVTLTWLLAGVAALAWIVAPVLRWLRTRIVITTRRLWIVRGRRSLLRVPLEVVERVRTKAALGAGPHGPGTLTLDALRGRVTVQHCPDVAAAAHLVEQYAAESRAVSMTYSPAPGTGWA